MLNTNNVSWKGLSPKAQVAYFKAIRAAELRKMVEALPLDQQPKVLRKVIELERIEELSGDVTMVIYCILNACI